jgi:hypothetical protein
MYNLGQKRVNLLSSVPDAVEKKLGEFCMKYVFVYFVFS